MATPYRSTVTIDGTKFHAFSASVVLSSNKTDGGMAEMGSLNTAIRVWVDMHDDTNVPFATTKKLFELANVVTRDKIKDMKVEFWKDDAKKDAICAYQFKGWISRFETSSLKADAPGGASNHLLVLDLEPALNQENFKELKITN